MKTYRDEILNYAAKRYGTTPEYISRKFREYTVLRHTDSKKQYAVIMSVPKEKLGLSGIGKVDIMDIKCDPNMGISLLKEKGFMSAYYVHKENWITVLLDGSVEKDMLFSLLDMSYDITKGGTQRKSPRTVNQAWLIPANPKYYDLEEGFAESDIMLWKQSSNVIVGDIIYIYMASPVSAIKYKCEAVEVDIPYQYDDGKLRISRAMNLKLLHRFEEGQLDTKKLKEYGVYAVRGPRSVPNSLLYEIKDICGEE